MSEPIWSIEKIKLGFERFLEEYGRLPTAREIDKIGYLPTSRTIQRQFGGLEKLRNHLGFDIVHYGKGSNRSKIAYSINSRGKEAEENIRAILVEKFGEMFVHIERPLRRLYKNRLDFYVFSPSGNFAVDVFFPQNLDSINNILNIKNKVYSEYIEDLYLIVANSDITQIQIDRIILNKKNQLKPNIKVLSIEAFLQTADKFKRYHPNETE